MNDVNVMTAADLAVATTDRRVTIGILKAIECSGPASELRFCLAEELDKNADKIRSHVLLNEETFLLYLESHSEDEAQFEANFLAEEMRQTVGRRLGLQSKFRIKISVLHLAESVIDRALRAPGEFLRYVEDALDEKKRREKSETQTERSRIAQSLSHQIKKPDRIVTYASGDVDNALSMMTEAQIDRLPFGVIKINSRGTILYFNAREAELTQLDQEKMIGRNFFRDIAPCTNRREFLGRFVEGVRANKLDVTFNYFFDFKMHPRNVRVRLKKSYYDDNYWILVEMDMA